MRRLTAAFALTCLVAAPVTGALAVAGPALAQSEAPSPPPEGEQPAAPEAVPGEEVCSAEDQRLVEVSGLVALDDGYAVLNDGTEFVDRQGVFILDGGCQVVDQIAYPSQPRDPEDLALDREANVLWIGDTGDNAAGGTGEGEVRATVALWRVELDGDRTPVIHRFTYPDAPQDAEALLLTGDGTPIIVTKQVGTAQLFIPTELRPSSGPDDAVALEAAGEFTPQDTEADHELGQAAEQFVTGGANAPDNSKVVLRTYTDAYEFDVADGDVATAVTEGEPRVTPLPDEPLGEAITYTADGAQFLTMSEVPEGAEFTPVLLSYAPAVPATPEEEGGGAAAPAAEAGEGGGSLFDSVQDIINIIAAVGIIGVVLVAAGIFGIVRARKRGSRGGGGGVGPGGPGDDGPVTGRARLTGGPDQGQGWAPEQPAGMYSSQAAREPEYGQAGYAGGADYRGGGDYQGNEYGGGQYGGGGGNEYGGADPYRQDQGYQDQPYDQQTWANGHQPQGYQQQQGYENQGYQGQEYQGQEYGGQGHQGQGHQGQGHQGQGHQAQGYPGQEYQGQGYQQGQEYQGQGYPDQAYAPPQEGGAYAGGTYQSAERGGEPGGDYANDPDYAYEFRQQQQQQGRWGS